MKKDQKYNKRKNSMEAYIDALIENNSKICTIRIDLGYGTPYANKVTLDDMNKDINNLLNNSAPADLFGQVAGVIRTVLK